MRRWKAGRFGVESNRETAGRLSASPGVASEEAVDHLVMANHPAKSESAAAGRSTSQSRGKGAGGFDGALAEGIMPPSPPADKGARYQLSVDEARWPYGPTLKRALAAPHQRGSASRRRPVAVLTQSYPRPFAVLVDKDHASRLKRRPDGGEGSRMRGRFVTLKANDRPL